LFFHFCVFAFIADDILGCGLAVRYGVFTLLFATAKEARVVLAKMYLPNLFHAFDRMRLKRRTATAMWPIQSQTESL
jgi:hypothetical protein